MLYYIFLGMKFTIVAALLFISVTAAYKMIDDRDDTMMDNLSYEDIERFLDEEPIIEREKQDPCPPWYPNCWFRG